MGASESRPVASLPREGFSPWSPGDPVPVKAPQPPQPPEILVRALGPTARLAGSKGNNVYYFIEDTGAMMEIDCVGKVLRKVAQQPRA
jgi:hypothetical protein